MRLAPGGCVTLEKQGHVLSWSIQNAQPATFVPDQEKAHFPRHPANRCTQANGLYKDIFPGVDLACHLLPGCFKDTLIFQDQNALRPVVFLLTAPGLSLEEQPSGAVSVQCGKERIFTLPPPCVVDGEGNPIPHTVQRSLEYLGQERWQWTVMVNPAYAAQAEYPLLLDPVVETEQTAAAMSMAYTSSKRPTTPYPVTGYSTNIANNDYSLGKCDTFLRFEDSALPAIDSSYYVTAATLTLKTVENSAATNVYVKDVLGSWTASTMNYNNRPAVSDKPLDYVSSPNNSGVQIHFNIANLVRKWYAGNNHGVMLETQAGGLVQLGGPGAVYAKPFVTINYVSLAGLESYLAQESHGCGRAGAAYVGLFNGNLVAAHQETLTNGNLLPVSVTRYYNSCYHDEAPFGVGKGWKLSCQQTLHKETIGGVVHYVLMDGDGTRHHFKQASGKWQDLSGLNLTLTISGSAAAITDKSDNKLLFDLPTAEFAQNWANVKMLKSLTNAQGTVMTFSLSGRDNAHFCVAFLPKTIHQPQ